jgi:alginate O-acetyltransferase complex protein AlgJ
MSHVSSLRYRYTQFFVLFMLGSLAYIMVQSIWRGATNFQDSLYEKSFLIEKANRLRMKIGNKVFPNVLLGKDGWMHYTGDGELNYFQNATKMENEKELVKRLKALNRYLTSQGITLLVAVAPDKSTIYPDTLPDQIKPLSKQSWLDSLLSYAGEKDMPLIIDLRPVLRAERQDRDVFYKTDTHWNGYGAFAAYKAIINTLKSSHPELQSYEISDLNLKLVTKDNDLHDTPQMLGINTITEPTLFIAPKKPFVQMLHPMDYYGYNQFSSIPDSTLPTLLAFHDSQGAHYLNNYLSMNFAKSYFVHYLSMPDYLTQEAIEQFKPDVIIIEIVERGLNQLDGLMVQWESP